MKNALLILSGGMDSVTMLYDHIDEIALAVSFDYGSNHNDKEIPFAQYHCKKLGVLHLTIPLKFMRDNFTSSLFSGADAIPEGSYADTNMKSTVVPFRNGIMLSIAAGIAESRGLTKVMNMSDAISAGTYAGITIDAPYTKISKAEIARRGKMLSIDYSQTWSCYKGESIHCGKCATCIERKAALSEAGIKDTTVYGA